MRGPAQHPCSRDARTKRRRGVSGPGRCWSSKVGAALGTRTMGARGQQRTQSRGGRRHPILERKGGAITKPLSPRGQGQRTGSLPLVGVGGVNPNFLNPDRCWGWRRPWIAVQMVQTSIDWDSGIFVGVLFPRAGPGSWTSYRALGEGSHRLCGGTAWWARPSALIFRPGIWDETPRPPPRHLGSPGRCP